MNRFFAILCMAWALSGCSPAPDATGSIAGSRTSSPITGADLDVHGCKASAGYTWSEVRGQCIRIFDAGLRFDPHPAPTQGAVLAAFVVLSPAQGDAVTNAEVFVPGRRRPIALTRVDSPAGDTRSTLLENKSEGVRLSRHNDEQVLEVNGQIFRPAGRPYERLFRIP